MYVARENILIINLILIFSNLQRKKYIAYAIAWKAHLFNMMWTRFLTNCCFYIECKVHAHCPKGTIFCKVFFVEN